MKQKIVINVKMPCDKCRKEAMKIAASEDGVISVSLHGKDKDQIVVVGKDVDSPGLCTTLRKKVGYAILVSVEEVKDPKPEEKKKKEEPKKKEEKDKPKEENKKKKKKKGNNNNNDKKKEEKDEKKSSCKCSGENEPGMYYHCPCPQPQYYCPPNNPQVFMCATVPNDDSPACNVM